MRLNKRPPQTMAASGAKRLVNLIIAPEVVVVERITPVETTVTTVVSVAAPVAVAASVAIIAAPIAAKSPTVKSSAAQTTSAEPSAVESATDPASVKATSAEAPAVAVATPAASGEHLVARNHQCASQQGNSGNRQFRPHDLLSYCNSESRSNPNLMHRRRKETRAYFPEARTSS
jgi:hypothetical protein